MSPSFIPWIKYISQGYICIYMCIYYNLLYKMLQRVHNKRFTMKKLIKHTHKILKDILLK